MLSIEAQKLSELLVANGLTISVAESCTGGSLSRALTSIPGASSYFDCGYITYSNQSKVEMLGVDIQTIKTYGAVSEEVAAEMARGALAYSNAQLAVSVTGIAGPGGSDFKPEGRVCFGLATPTNAGTQTVEFGALGRANVRHAARDHALEMILSALSKTA